jgi:hypothetical protein
LNNPIVLGLHWFEDEKFGRWVIKSFLKKSQLSVPSKETIPKRLAEGYSSLKNFSAILGLADVLAFVTRSVSDIRMITCFAPLSNMPL